AAITALRQQIGEIERRHADVAARLAKEFPNYAALTEPAPLGSLAAQGLLTKEEALVFWQAGDKQSYLFAVTREGFRFHVIPVGPQKLSDMVTGLREGLDVEQLGQGIDVGNRVLFDLGRAYELYALLLGPVEDLIKAKRRLLLVPTASLTAVPFHLLVTDK